jgi:hypothetical protein
MISSFVSSIAQVDTAAKDHSRLGRQSWLVRDTEVVGLAADAGYRCCVNGGYFGSGGLNHAYNTAVPIGFEQALAHS